MSSLKKKFKVEVEVRSIMKGYEGLIALSTDEGLNYFLDKYGK